MHTRMYLAFLLLLGGCGEGARASSLGDAAPEPPESVADAADLPREHDGGAPYPSASDGGGASTEAAGKLDACADGCRPPAAMSDSCRELLARAELEVSAERISLAQLMCEAVAIDRFSGGADKRYRARMASSYDRASETDGGWFANGDRGVFVRSQGDEHVMMESHKPGVITRIWTPNPSGLIRIYVDDEDTPAIEAPMAELLSGRLGAPFAAPFVFEAAEAYSSYLPIPYSRYARVTTTSDASLYYQVELREYAEDTAVEPYSAQAVAALAPLTGTLQRWLDDATSRPALATRSSQLALRDSAPEQRIELGPAVIRELVVRGFDSSEAWLRNTRMVLTIDGERTVDAPIGDLFGSGPGFYPHESLGARVNEQELVLRWPMPVARTLEARIESNGGKIGELTLELRHTPGLPPDYHLFYAVWTGPRAFDTTEPVDWTVLHFRGSGWYVGTTLNVTNPTWWWWGEGDEKVFVDGEAFPSRFGTGTEDYFGFGWCSNELFAQPWNGQTRADGPLNHGRSSQYRWHVSDAIPFGSELRMTLEVSHWVTGAFSVALTQDAVAYWYARPGGSNLAKPLALSEFRIPPLPPPDLSVPREAYTCRN